MKQCTKCGELKAPTAFCKCKKHKDGLSYWCKRCQVVNRDRIRKNDVRSRLREGARDRATANGLEFEVELEDIVVPLYCPILGVVLTLDSKATSTSPSLDRIDSSKGYVKGNVAVISKRANTIKNNGTAAEHLAIYKWMMEQGVQ